MSSNHDTSAPGAVADAPELLNISDAAAYLSVSRSFIEKAIYTDGTLPALRIVGARRMVRIRRADLDALLEPVVNP